MALRVAPGYCCRQYDCNSKAIILLGVQKAIEVVETIAHSSGTLPRAIEAIGTIEPIAHPSGTLPRAIEAIETIEVLGCHPLHPTNNPQGVTHTHLWRLWDKTMWVVPQVGGATPPRGICGTHPDSVSGVQSMAPILPIAFGTQGEYLCRYPTTSMAPMASMAL